MVTSIFPWLYILSEAAINNAIVIKKDEVENRVFLLL